MGLLDVLNGMQNGPRGEPASNTSAASGSGAGSSMSPMTMAVFGLLAYKAVKQLTSAQPHLPTSDTQSRPMPSPQTVTSSDTPSGAFGDLLKGGLGGLLASGATGSILSEGLGELIKQFQKSGQSEAAKSWVAQGPNREISPIDLARVLHPDQIETLMAQTGLSREELLMGLSQHLPEAVNALTPEGRLPTQQEASRWV